MLDSGSLKESLLSLPEPQRLQLIQSLPDEEAEALLFDWPLWARPNQLTPPGEWFLWVIMAGRGYGKTRAGAEFVIAEAKEMPGSFAPEFPVVTRESRRNSRKTTWLP